MAALAKDTQRTYALHTPQIVGLPAAAAVNLFAGALTATTAAGLAVPASDTAGLIVQGVCREGLNNTDGAAGTLGTALDYSDAVRSIRVDAQGEWLFAVSAGAPLPGGTAFAVDDNTVSAAATTNNIVAGKFTRPYGPGAWFVDIERR